MAHHNIDLWRTTWPVGGNGLWAIYQVGGAWLCQHIWEHYLFTQDKRFLKEYFPILYEASFLCR
jgi:alpha-L-fucosidase 2